MSSYPRCAHIFTVVLLFFFQAEDGIRDDLVTGVQTCALPISSSKERPGIGPLFVLGANTSVDDDKPIRRRSILCRLAGNERRLQFAEGMRDRKARGADGWEQPSDDAHNQRENHPFDEQLAGDLEGESHV